MDSPDFSTLYRLLESNKLVKIVGSNSRCNFPEYMGGVFGLSRARFSRKNGKRIDLSALSIKYPETYKEIIKIGEFYKFPHTSIQVNKNLTCPPHKDRSNVGDSLLVSFGQYTGGEIVIDGVTKSAYHNPQIFNGHNLTHYNLPHIGTKYSLVFFSIKLPPDAELPV